jgi:hypothetical protein
VASASQPPPKRCSKRARKFDWPDATRKDGSRLWRPTSMLLVAVPDLFNADFASKGPVDERKVTGGEYHAENPPNQTDL